MALRSCERCGGQFAAKSGSDKRLCSQCALDAQRGLLAGVRGAIRCRPITFAVGQFLTSAAVLIFFHVIDTPRVKPQPKTEVRTVAASDVFAKVAPSLVSIETVDMDGNLLMSGSGVIIGGSGTVISNAHVTSPPKANELMVDVNGTERSVKLLDVVDHERDMSRFNLGKSIDGLKINTHAPSIGQRVFAIGDSMGLRKSLSEGIVSGIRQGANGRFVQFTAPVSHGSSGGALVNEAGELIGLICSGLDDASNIGFAASSEDVLAFLSRQSNPRNVCAVAEKEVAPAVVVATEPEKKVPIEEMAILPTYEAVRLVKECSFFVDPEEYRADVEPLMKQAAKRCGIKISDDRSNVLRVGVIQWGDNGSRVVVDVELIQDVMLAGKRIHAVTWVSDPSCGDVEKSQKHETVSSAVTEALADFIAIRNGTPVSH